MLPIGSCSRSLVALLLCGAMLASAVGSEAGSFIAHGHFQRMMESGDTAGRVKLAALAATPGHWGVGALAGLKGEVVQVDGRLLVSRGVDAQGRVGPPLEGDEAALFAGARVARWVGVPVPADLDAAGLERFVREQARVQGLGEGEPFVFLVEGQFPQLRWHVVTGDAPAGQAGHGHAAPAGHGAHHANRRAGLRVFHQPGATGQLVGVYSGQALEGVVSHAGERLHLHYIDAGHSVSGHVDAVRVAAGAVLKLPGR